MPAEKLDKIFKPESLAVIGASEKEGSVGYTLMENIVNLFEGDIYPVNINRDEVMDIEAFSSVSEIENEVDLAVIATPAKTVPDIVDECGKSGIEAAIVISAGFSETGDEGKKLENAIEEKRKKHEMRILGPNCLGTIRPGDNVNLTFLRKDPAAGKVAFLSQSGAMGSAILDWSTKAKVGFSAFVSVGNMLDIDFGDLIDYFGQDPKTNSIIMYMETVKNAEKFMSAARGFARTKPILVIKAGKYSKSAEAVASHTGSLAGEDQIYDAAFKRAGVTRVSDVDDLFSSSETLSKQNLPDGPSMAIITNAGGPGIMTTDAILDSGGKVADLSSSTEEKLTELLPPQASKKNPVDVLGDAGPSRYKDSIRICAEDENVDGIIVIYAPQGEATAQDAAKAVADVSGETEKPIVTSFMGAGEVDKGRQVLRESDVPTRPTPEQAISAYMYMHRYARNLELLYETPEELPTNSQPPHHHLKALVRKVLSADRTTLTEVESKKFLDTYDIPTSPTKVAESPDQAANLAYEIGYPVVLKIYSHDITHKTDVGGVELNLQDKEEVKEAYERIVSRAKNHRPSAEVLGVTVQKMISNVDYELILGSKKDPLFGASILFGRGGTGVELYKDTSAGFPPLNQVLAHRLMEDTKVYQLLKGYRGREGADIRELEKQLIRFSQLIIDFPEIKEIDINPLAVIDGSFRALDARIILDEDFKDKQVEKSHEHLAISPYPREYVEDWRLSDGRNVTLRPIRPEDEPLEFELFDSFSDKTWRQRFFGPRTEITHEEMTRYTNIDYRREMAIIGILGEGEDKKMVGVGRLIIGPDQYTGEYAVVVGDPWQKLGLGEKLTDSIIGVAEDKGLRSIYATILKNNKPMLQLARKMGFQEEERDSDTVKMVLRLR
ncbi:bifunctional acetate--CoA ligase family protein/GNAT family N-acetyltransferase [Candidatus Bipolaricaulota bacterium]|nr:bifunctional acetate--CoA ligase family protein/GNAT family N-acetyltransferase [Candidatus Bipolaricaulota bacterium]